MDQPNTLVLGWQMLRQIVGTRRPVPSGEGVFAHESLAPVLEALKEDGIPGAIEKTPDLDDYLAKVATVDPDTLNRDQALAYWVNVYNAGAIRLAVDAWAAGVASVLRVPGAFDRKVIEVAGEHLSLGAIEHGKVRRFADPRVHGALVCGSLSCPTLRPEPYEGDGLGGALDEQMRVFLSNGGAVVVDGTVELSRIFLWYGADFVRPHRMPSLMPVTKGAVYASVEPWLPRDMVGYRSVKFQDYDWSLACAVR